MNSECCNFSIPWLLGDKTGRKPTCVVSLGFYALVSFGAAFSPNIETLLLMRLFTGLFNGGSYSLAYLIALECTGEEYLGRVALLSQVYFCSHCVFTLKQDGKDQEFNGSRDNEMRRHLFHSSTSRLG